MLLLPPFKRSNSSLTSHIRLSLNYADKHALSCLETCTPLSVQVYTSFRCLLYHIAPMRDLTLWPIPEAFVMPEIKFPSFATSTACDMV